MSDMWEERNNPWRLERRVEFPDYTATRAFLERAAALSEAEDIHPDITFGSRFVSLRLSAEAAGEEGEAGARAFAARLDGLLDGA